MHLPLLISSTPKMPAPETPSKRKEKKAQKTIEGYINSYIQKSKKEAKARRNKKQNGERGDKKDAPSSSEERTKQGPAQLSYSSCVNRTAIPVQEGYEKDSDVVSMYSASSGVGWWSAVERARVETHWREASNVRRAALVLLDRSDEWFIVLTGLRKKSVRCCRALNFGSESVVCKRNAAFGG
jgi:hypothetical protein